MSVTVLSIERLAKAPRERVFAVASDLANAPNVIPAITKLEILTSGPVGEGTRFRETRRMFGSAATEEMTISRFDPPNGYTVVADSHGSKYESTFSFDEVPEGTRIRLRFEGRPYTVAAKILSFLFRGMTKKMGEMIAKDLEAIAKASEG